MARTIEFAQGSSFTYQPAPALKRFLALCIDLGIVGSIQYGIIAVLGAVFVPAAVAVAVFADSAKALAVRAAAALAGVPDWIVIVLLAALAFLALLVLYALAFGVAHAYFLFFEYRRHATPGKRMFGLSVVSVDGNPLTFRQCLLRELTRMLEAGLILPALVSIATSRDRRRIGDFMAGTLVAHSAAEEAEDSAMYLPATAYLRLQARYGEPTLAAAAADEFLEFAFPAFVYPRTPPSAQTRAIYAAKARACYAPGEDPDEGEIDEFLRFHAENCLRARAKAP